MTQAHDNNAIPLDAAPFDRLVDGELTAEERRHLLASLDTRKNGWRQCALAFLEAQSWGQQFQQIVAPADRRTTASPMPAVALPPPAPSGARRGRWFAIAAGLLLAFSLGWITKTGPAHQKSLEIARQEVPPRDELPKVNSDDAVTLLVRDTSGKQQRLQVPLMEVGELNNQFATSLPANVRNSIRDQGFDVHRRRRFAPMFFEQNKEFVPMVVPVDDTVIVPVDRPIY